MKESSVIPKKSASAANPSTFHPGFAENAAEKAVGTCRKNGGRVIRVITKPSLNE